MINKFKRAVYQKKYQDIHKEEIKIKRHEYYIANKEAWTIWRKEYNASHKKEIAENNKKYCIANKGDIAAKKKTYTASRKEEIAKYQKAYRLTHKEREREQGRKKQRKNRTNERHILDRRMTDSIRDGLKLKGNKKNGKSWRDCVDYSISELKTHLEKKFKKGMGWDNAGKWHIDHKIPKSAFNYSSMDDLDFKRCWALSNLQPIWKEDNLKKAAKLKKPFQPALKITIESMGKAMSIPGVEYTEE